MTMMMMMGMINLRSSGVSFVEDETGVSDRPKGGIPLHSPL